MTQKVLEIDLMVYNMTNDDAGTENQQISKITNVQNDRNIRKWRAIEFFCEISEN